MQYQRLAKHLRWFFTHYLTFKSLHSSKVKKKNVRGKYHAVTENDNLCSNADF